MFQCLLSISHHGLNVQGGRLTSTAVNRRVGSKHTVCDTKSIAVADAPGRMSSHGLAGNFAKVILSQSG